MNGLFIVDGPVGKAVSRITGFVVLSLLWLLCSLPLVTMGAANTALYTMTLRMVRNEDGKTATGFFRAFKDNFKEATIIHFFLAAALLFLGGYWLAVGMLPEKIQPFFQGFCILVAIQMLMELLFVYPVQARFENTVWNTMKNAWMIAAGHFPVFLAVCLIAGLPVGIFLANTVLFIRLFPFWILLAPGLIAWLNSFLFDHCFKKYIPEEEDR